MVDNISWECRHRTKTKPMEMVNLFKNLQFPWREHCGPGAILQLSFIKNANKLEIYMGHMCNLLGTNCAENGEVDCVLEAVLSMTETGNEKQQVSLSLGNADFLWWWSSAVGAKVGCSEHKNRF